jgi:hypothetical protein
VSLKEIRALAESFGATPTDTRDPENKVVMQMTLNELAKFAAYFAYAATPKGWKLVPEKISDAMIESGMEGHYGKRRVRQQGGAFGIDMTVNNHCYNGYEAMRRIWKGALSAAPNPPVQK